MLAGYRKRKTIITVYVTVESGGIVARERKSLESRSPTA